MKPIAITGISVHRTSKGRAQEAEGIFKAWLQHDPRSKEAIDVAWAIALVERGTELLVDDQDEEAKAQFALAKRPYASAISQGTDE